MDLVDGQRSSDFIHPFSGLKLFGELSLDVSDDGVTKLLSLSREGLLNEESAQNPANAVVDMANTLTPSLGCCVGVLRMISKEEAEGYAGF
jgi:hypothetical protein